MEAIKKKNQLGTKETDTKRMATPAPQSLNAFRMIVRARVFFLLFFFIRPMFLADTHEIIMYLCNCGDSVAPDKRTVQFG